MSLQDGCAVYEYDRHEGVSPLITALCMHMVRIVQAVQIVQIVQVMQSSNASLGAEAYCITILNP